MNEFNVGDKVWWAVYERQSITKQCPICFGKLSVTLILGNGDHVETECDYCNRGFQPAQGYVDAYEYVSAVKQVEITGKEIQEGIDGKSVKYMHDNYILTHDNAFRTKAEAEDKLTEIIKKTEDEDLKRLEYDKNNNPQKYSWHVGYYQNLRRKALKEIERCDRKITYFKSKVKQEKLDQLSDKQGV